MALDHGREIHPSRFMEKLKLLGKSMLDLAIRAWQGFIMALAFVVLLVNSFILACLSFLATGDWRKAAAIFARVVKG